VSTVFRPVLLYFAAVLMPREAEVLALVDVWHGAGRGSLHRTISLGICAGRACTLADLRCSVSASDREIPLVTDANCTRASDLHLLIRGSVPCAIAPESVSARQRPDGYRHRCHSPGPSGQFVRRL
jgi:hypothetical protein